MHTTQLAQRFLADWPAPHSPQGELVYGVPRRQRELIEIGRQQIDVQKSAARAIVDSNVASAHVIAMEVEQHTRALEAALESYSTGISSAISDAADQMSAAIESLGDMLCVYLGDIRWQLVQHGDTLNGILQVLRKSRSNEARQLVEQGVRHYANEQFDRAEERFRQALRCDTTDYQVLMNLGLIAIQKGQAREALGFFTDALRLPARLDESSKNRALLAIARLHYAERNYEAALTMAREAEKCADAGQVEEIFLLATYAGLAGKFEECVKDLERAIRLRPDLFGRAAIDPGLETARQPVLATLSRIAVAARNAVDEKVDEARERLTAVRERPESTMFRNEMDLAGGAIDRMREFALRSSYQDLLRLRGMSEKVTTAIRKLHEAEIQESLKLECDKLIPKLMESEAAAKEKLELSQPVFPPFRIRWWFLWHIVTWFLIFPIIIGHTAVEGHEGAWWVGLSTTWFWLGIPLWWVARGYSAEHAERVSRRRSEVTAAAAQALGAAQAEVFGARRRRSAHETEAKDLVSEARTTLQAVFKWTI